MEFLRPKAVAFVNVNYLRIQIRSGGIETAGAIHCQLGVPVQSNHQAKLEGIFAQWDWNGTQVEVLNDRYGFYPLYYFCTNKEFNVSPSILKLLELGAPNTLDDAGLAVFLRLGYYIGDDTPFLHIRALPPASRLIWREGRLQIESKFFAPKAISISREEAVQRHIELVRASVCRRLPANENFALPLSGGRDSRHVLFELCRAGFRPLFCVTHRQFPPRDSSDVDCARQITETLGIKHVILNQPRSRLTPELRKNLKTGFCSDEHSQCMVLSDYLANRVETTYEGVAGSSLASSHLLRSDLLAFFAAGRLRELALNLFHWKEQILRHLLSKEAYFQFGPEVACERLVPELARHAPAPSPVGSFNLWNRNRREINLFATCILDRTPVVHTPYMDHALLDFLTALPVSVNLGWNLRSAAITLAFPQFAHIPYEADSQVQDISYFRGYARELACFLLSQRPQPFFRMSYVMPRLLRCIADSKYSPNIDRLAVLVTYLSQLAAVLNSTKSQLAIMLESADDLTI